MDPVEVPTCPQLPFKATPMPPSSRRGLSPGFLRSGTGREDTHSRQTWSLVQHKPHNGRCGEVLPPRHRKLQPLSGGPLRRFPPSLRPAVRREKGSLDPNASGRPDPGQGPAVLQGSGSPSGVPGSEAPTSPGSSSAWILGLSPDLPLQPGC